MISVLAFTLFMMIKGGWHWRIPGLERFKEGAIGWFIDGTQLSAILAGTYIGFHAGIGQGALFALAWWIGVMMSMGEEAGAVGRWGHAWKQYIEWMPELKSVQIFGRTLFEYREGRAYGVKKAIQRGVFLGALLTLATAFPGFILAGASFPIAYFLGSSLTFLTTKKPESWTGAEPIYGAIVGLAAAHYLGF